MPVKSFYLLCKAKMTFDLSAWYGKGTAIKPKRFNHTNERRNAYEKVVLKKQYYLDKEELKKFRTYWEAMKECIEEGLYPACQNMDVSKICPFNGAQGV